MAGSERLGRWSLRLLDEIGRIHPNLLGWAYQRAQAQPFLRARLEREYARILSKLRLELEQSRGRFPVYRRLPARGVAGGEILAAMRAAAEQEQERWQSGRVSGAVYHGGAEHVQLLSDVYGLYSQSNPLHADVWPSAGKYEAEIISMTAGLLGAAGASADAPARVCGSVTSGGTESILLAMKAYRDCARAERNIARPEIVVPETAHAAFDKAAEYFGIRRVNVPVGSDLRADVAAMGAAITDQTIALVASAPSYPHGVIDPVAELGALASARGIGLHVDACLGAFLLPFARELGYAVPAFDFQVQGVSSMSADTHKYGYAAKGTSVVLYADPKLRRYQYFVATDWPGGLYFSPTLSGSRPGALSAACWAALVHLGHDGYLDAARRILETAARIRAGVQRIAGLRLIGDSLWVITFGAEDFDIYCVLDAMSRRGWSLNGLHRPACIHLCVTLRQTEPGVAERFLADLTESVSEARSTPAGSPGLAPLYGLAARLPVRGAVADLIRRYVDLLYET
jgi:glutamate/tyrosine decarboxylase-like PLP-dependent enzyme